LYIGCTTDFDARYKQHVKMIYDKKHHNQILQNYIEQIGVANLRFEILFLCHETDLLFYEKFFTDYFRPITKVSAISKAFPDPLKYVAEYDLIKKHFEGQEVSAKRLAELLNVNLKRVGMICKELGFAKRKKSNIGGAAFYKI